MKINVTIDLSDFYQEDEESVDFSTQIKDYIVWHVKHEVLKDWKAKITNEFTNHVILEIEKSKNSVIDETLKELAVTAKIKKQYSSNEMISIVDYIKEELKRTHLSDDHIRKFITNRTRNENDRLKELADSISKELKERYNLLFASQIVSKLNDNGMLKDNVAKLILDK